MVKGFLKKLTVTYTLLVIKFPAFIMESSSPCSQKSATGPYLEPNESRRCLQTHKWSHVLTVLSYGLTECGFQAYGYKGSDKFHMLLLA